MKMFDATPLFRSSVGFDGMMDMFESVNRLDQTAPNYPPYNIEKTGESECQRRRESRPIGGAKSYQRRGVVSVCGGV